MNLYRNGNWPGKMIITLYRDPIGQKINGVCDF